MSTYVADSTTHRLAQVPTGGPISGGSIGVPSTASGAGACVITLHTNEGETHAAVRTVALNEVPPGVVAIGDDLASAWDVDLDRTQWRLERREPVPVSSLTLELPTERDPASTAVEIAKAGLVGELLWIPAGGAEQWLDVNGVPHRIRSINAHGRTGVLASITRNTEITLYASAVRAGVDIVVLADCSGSMQIDDLPENGEASRLRPGGSRWLTRMEALQRALQDMLRMRLHISGRISRLAVLEFNHTTRQRFPRVGGMAQLDAASSPHEVDEFRHGVALFRPDGTTDIGNALHEAANLLYEHGHTGNEKLIVLVSDGAEWSPKGEKGSGELVLATTEPVSLMAHLHRDMGIRLHAIGVSTAELFHRRGTWQPHPASIPNHTLLKELVKVGGGDPTKVGGLDVLEDYFSGLATGMVHQVRERLTEARKPGPLPEPTRLALSRLTAESEPKHEIRRDELRVQVLERVGLCNNEAVRGLGGPIWDVVEVSKLCQRFMVKPLDSDQALTTFLAKIVGTLRPNALAAGVTEVTGPWSGVLNRLESLSRHSGPIAARFGPEFGITVSTPADVHVEVMQRVHDELAALGSSLRRLPDHEAPLQEPPSVTGFTYRD